MPDGGAHPSPSSSPSAASAGMHVGRRLGALIVDWVIASAISAGFLDYHPLATLGVFALMTALLLMTLGATIGHRLFGLVVRRNADGGVPCRPLQAVVRTVALCLVVPAGIWGPDGRGLHDVWAGTAVGRR